MNRRRSGLTVLETVIALGILSVVLLGLISLFLTGIRAVDNSAEVTAATNLGREFMEVVKTRGYAATAIGSYDGRKGDRPDEATGFPFAPYPSESVDGNDYHLVVRCEDETLTIRSVNVDVYWDLQREAKLSFQLWVHQ